MNDYELTAFHEAGHAALWLLEEEYLGELALVTVIPYGDSLGRVRPADLERKANPTPEGQRAVGRMIAGGFTAERLAGGAMQLETARKDMGLLARLALQSKRGERFSTEAMAGAELLLRAHWGAVESIAKILMRLGELTAPHGINVARGALREAPRPLSTSLETFGRLLERVEQVPELREAFTEALGVKLAPAPPAKPRRAEPSRRTDTRATTPRTWTRATTSYLRPVAGIG